jgi:hypothetical protein
MVQRRHKGDTATFEELDFQGQSRAMNAAAAQFRKMLNAHLRRAASERRDIDKIRSSRLGLLERILTAYR